MAHFVGSTDLLLANGTFTSVTKWADTYDKVTGSVYSDHDGTVYIEQSPDGANWDVSSSYPITAADGSGFSEELVCPFWRVRYVNGTTNQGTFRLAFKTAFEGQ